ncbi:hypothetical protein ScPMuIL_004431 [Solemya velum]
MRLNISWNLCYLCHSGSIQNLKDGNREGDIVPASSHSGIYHVRKAESGKLQGFGSSMMKSIVRFFGLEEDAADQKELWQNRRQSYYRGKIKKDHVKEAPGLDYIDSPDRECFRDRPTTVKPKESVFKMTWKGIKYLSRKKPKKKAVRKPVQSRSVSIPRLHSVEGKMIGDRVHEPRRLVNHYSFFDDDDYKPFPAEGLHREGASLERIRVSVAPTTIEGEGLDEPDFSFDPMTRVAKELIREEPEGRRPGMGFMGRLCDRKMKKQAEPRPVGDDHRPYFTWWVTFVQIVIFIVSVSVYGFAPIGVSETMHKDLILKPDLRLEKAAHLEIDNFWMGPRQADLIHLGAKYSPCMRRDEQLESILAVGRAEEKSSGCCIRDDGSGCSQMTREKCSDFLSSFEKWSPTNRGPRGQVSGAVCGTDPTYCKTPASVATFKWDENDITKWPLCTETGIPNNTQASKSDRHMTCNILGRPCCHGIQGECMITTREHCDFMRGHFHQDAFLCSQVNCLNQICGMISFSDPNRPDQFYRLWTSLFLHGGFVHLIISVLFQMLFMRDMEKLFGCIRISIIYLGSGIGGNLASITFLPYQVEVGPAGSQFGILACFLVELLTTSQKLEKPIREYLKLGGFILVLFLLGFLPWIDNWAHLSGFIFGFFFAFAFIPYSYIGAFSVKKKAFSVVFALLGISLLYTLFIIIFYVLPLENCDGCQYFNCIPFTPKFCQNMDVTLKRNTTYNSW